MRAFLPAVFVLLGVAAHAEPDTPRIACAAPVYDFGRVSNVGQVSHVFRVANEGTAPLTIHSVDTACGCTAAKAGTNAAVPGAHTEILVRFDTANRTGPQRRAIYVQSNDRTNPIFRLEIRGDIFGPAAADPTGAPVVPVSVQARKESATASPDRLAFGRVRSFEQPEGHVLVSAEGTNELKVLEVSSSSASLQAKVGQQGGGNRVVTAKLLPRPIGRESAELLIHTTHPAMREIRIPVTWEAIGDIYATPSEISLVTVPGQTNAVCRYIAFRSRSGKPFKIERVVAPDSGMTVTLDNAPSNTWRCEIQGISPSTNLNGRSFVAFTDRGDEEWIEVPVKVAR